MDKTIALQRAAFLGNYPPRQCGIATFTQDLCTAFGQVFPGVESYVVSVTDDGQRYDYLPEVRFEIEEQHLESYERAAEFLNFADPDVLCVQHEYGIYGGLAGSHVLALMRQLRMPIVTTLHTVLENPRAAQRRVLSDLARHSARLVVMAERGADLLRRIYRVPEEKIALIPHGIPDTPFVDPHFFKEQLGVEGRIVLLTFGLLSPNKGIEYAIDALPRIVAEFPEVVYIVLGATHPHLVREQGEIYRLSLERRAKRAGVGGHVIFLNRFVTQAELTDFLGAANLYLTPYLNEDQITSGTLAYAFGLGKAVVSTPYWHARELLADGRGKLVPFRSADAIAGAVLDLLRHETQHRAIRRQSYKIGRDMVWPAVARRYGEVFEKARASRGAQPRARILGKTLDQQMVNVPVFRAAHLLRMTDNVGLLQHAVFTVPDRAHGYCIDDNARALLLAVLLEEMELRDLSAVGPIFEAFVNSAFNSETGRFRNFMSYDRRWLEDAGSEDSHGRALWALGICVGRSRRAGLREWASGLFGQALAAVETFEWPRAWAFSLLGLHEYLQSFAGDLRAVKLATDLTDRLLRLFRQNAAPDWLWLEEKVTYDNAKIPHALILRGAAAGQSEAFSIGLDSLHWLVDQQMSASGHFQPVGSNGFWPRHGERARYDQQPIEAQATVSACIAAYRTTGDARWMRAAQQAFDWFLGSNDLGLSVYDPLTGGCCDGLHIDRLNENQGAESTLAYHLALAEMRVLQSEMSAFGEGPPPPEL
jgi:glycosyltransferase involved in cell wall biosynthesis